MHNIPQSIYEVFHKTSGLLFQDLIFFCTQTKNIHRASTVLLIHLRMSPLVPENSNCIKGGFLTLLAPMTPAQIPCELTVQLRIP